MSSFERELAEGRMDYTKHQAHVRAKGQRVFGPGGPMKRAYIRAQTDERRNDFHRFEQGVLKREAERREREGR